MKRMAPKLLKYIKNQLLVISPQDKNHVMSADMTISDFRKKMEQYASMITEYNQLISNHRIEQILHISGRLR